MNNKERIDEGILLLETMWYEIANRIVSKAILIYNLNEEQADALRDVYLKPNEYIVSIK